MNLPYKIVVVVGTRPEAIKLLPVFFQLKATPGYDPVLLSTGQHKDMLYQIFDSYQVSPDHDLDVMKHVTNLATLTAHLFLVLDKFLEEHKPDMVMVQGDTTSAMVGAMAAFYRQIPIAHVEAGLRTHTKYSPFPEEVNRQIIGRVADLNFAPTEIASLNLLKEGGANVHIVGNTVIDSLLYICNQIRLNEQYYVSKFAEIPVKNGDNVLITSHRRENHGEGLRSICLAVSKLAKKYPDLNWVFPVHLNPKVKDVVHTLLGNISNVFLLPPLQYDDLVFFMRHSKLILTDSGGIQEEAPSLNVPVVVLRETTERPEGIANGCAVIAGTAELDIIAAFEHIINDMEVYSKMAEAPNPYGDGQSSKRIVDLIQHYREQKFLD
jgi:UDP-N-acetylglucosamine 2-epimerase (non-hydrolysing)